jgi:hypothetical protein
MKMEKVIKEGKVAVLISHGFGAGWYTWNSNHKQLLFHHKIVEITEEWVLENLSIPNIYCGGAEDLTIHWLPEGTAFSVEEYDGAESLRLIEDLAIIA